MGHAPPVRTLIRASCTSVGLVTAHRHIHAHHSEKRQALPMSPGRTIKASAAENSPDSNFDRTATNVPPLQQGFGVMPTNPWESRGIPGRIVSRRPNAHQHCQRCHYLLPKNFSGCQIVCLLGSRGHLARMRPPHVLRSLYGSFLQDRVT